MVGDIPSALTYLSKAIDLGFRNVERIVENENLASLQNNETFLQLMASLKSSDIEKKEFKCKRMEQRMEKQAERRADLLEKLKRAQQPAEKQAEKLPEAEKKEETIEKPAEKVETPIEKAAEKAETPIDKPAEKAETLIEKPAFVEKKQTDRAGEIDFLVSMGFDRKKSAVALRLAKGSLTRAVEILLH